MLTAICYGTSPKTFKPQLSAQALNYLFLSADQFGGTVKIMSDGYYPSYYAYFNI